MNLAHHLLSFKPPPRSYVLIWSDSSYSLLVSLFGCMSAGLVAVPLLEGGEKEAIR